MVQTRVVNTGTQSVTEQSEANSEADRTESSGGKTVLKAPMTAKVPNRDRWLEPVLDQRWV